VLLYQRAQDRRWPLPLEEPRDFVRVARVRRADVECTMALLRGESRYAVVSAAYSVSSTAILALSKIELRM